MKEELITHDGGFDHYYFIEPGSDYGEIMWRDIGLLEKATLLPTPIHSSNSLLQFLHHAHFSFAINKKVNLPFQTLWAKQYALSHIKFDDQKKYCVIYTDISACRTDTFYLEKLSQKKNIVMVMVMANVVASKEKLLKQRFKYFKYVFSWDKADVEKYGMVYHSTYYSRIEMPSKGTIESDCFFIGSSKGRLEVLQEIHKRVTAAGGKAEFYITNVDKKDQTEPGIHYNYRLPYSTVLANDMASNCIIEVIAGNQVGQTLRAEEAIIGNKKLLTNNVYMKDNPYYKTGFIRVFKELCDEDIDFIMRKEDVEYNYQDDYSPILLIDHINSLEENE